MTFKLYREASAAAGSPITSKQALTAAFRSYMGVRYHDWTEKSGETKASKDLDAALKKAEWEFDAFASEPAKQPETYTGALGALETRLVKALQLSSLFAEGTQAFAYQNAAPIISDKTWEHIFHGEAKNSGGNKTHVGLHSMVKVIAGNHSSGKARAEITFVKGEEDAETRVYKAMLTIFAKPKASTFFPDSFTEPNIRTWVTAAAKYWMAAAPEARIKRNEAPTLVNWAGLALVDLPGAVKHRMWIGGLGNPSAATGITTAFPQFRGSFMP